MKDNKKMTKTRYAKPKAVTPNVGHWVITQNPEATQDEEQTDDEQSPQHADIDHITALKANSRANNPIIRARKPATYPNPNLPGKNNSMNAWLDVQLNGNLTTEENQQVMYAKKNADTSRFMDIDDVPSRGPPTHTHAEIVRTAEYLMNNDNIPICRTTGIRVQGEINDDDPRPPQQVMYAKRNADTSRFMDIDDVPSRGPPTHTHAEIVRTAEYLMNNDNIPICRTTGIRVQGEISDDDPRPPHRWDQQRRPTAPDGRR